MVVSEAGDSSKQIESAVPARKVSGVVVKSLKCGEPSPSILSSKSIFSAGALSGDRHSMNGVPGSASIPLVIG
ncbi:hypothetical protein, partial [Phaeodactylibacter xiamenensis]|uniref:hypothetical protein n=1 Tax=Phaeodactylibacter xiamenensis TaxID=1524460 RepID=UPI0024A8ABC6